MQQKLFLSYARADDKPFVRQLYTDLHNAGYDVWFDEVSMPNRGLTFLQSIRDAIDASDRFLLVIGPGALRSDYVKAEWQHALVFAKALIPLLRQGNVDSLPPELKLPDVLDFTEGQTSPSYSAVLQKLLRQLSVSPLPVGPLLTTVPVLPLHFVQRQDIFDALDLLVKGDGLQPIVIAGARQAVALVGMGGLGKSVMAAALVRSAKARRFFKDGIVWVEVGERRSLLDAARSLLAIFGSEDWNASWSQIKVELPKAIADRNCLIVLDDIWAAGELRIIQGALGNSGRMLMTTRFPELAEDLDAPVVKQLDQMSEIEALQLLAIWVDVDHSSLPLAAQEVARECGYLPLALALCGAMARTLNWQTILQGLLNANSRLLSKVYAAMETSLNWLKTIDPEAAALYTTLSVFPSDRPVAVAAIAVYWQHHGSLDPASVQFMLVGLHRKALLHFQTAKDQETTDRDVATQVDYINLHDLQYDYLRHINAGRKQQLHAQLLDAYAATCNGDWTQIQNDGYIMEHIGIHLTEAGKGTQLQDLLLNFNWLYRKLKETGISELFNDFDRVKNTPPLTVLRRALYQSAPAINKDPAQLAGQLLGRLGLTNEPALLALLEQAKQWRGSPWLQPVLPSLLPPNAALSMILTGHEGTVRTIAFSPDGRLLASAGNSHNDRTVRVWDLYSGTEVHVFDEQAIGSGRTGMAFTYTSRHLLIAYDNELRVWDLQKGRMSKIIPEQRAAVPASTASLLLTTGAEQTQVWDTVTWTVKYTMLTDPRRSLLTLSHNGEGIAYVEDGALVVLEWRTGNTQQFDQDTTNLRLLTFGPNNNELFWRNDDQSIHRLNTATGLTDSILLEEPLDAIVSFDVQSGHLLTGSHDGNKFPSLFDCYTGKRKGYLQVSTNDDPRDRVPSCLALSPGGGFAVLCDYHHRIEIWDTSKLKETQEDEVHRAVAFQFTDDSQFLWLQPEADSKGILLAVDTGQEVENDTLAEVMKQQENRSSSTFQNHVGLSEKGNWLFLDQKETGQLYAERSAGKGAEYEEPDKTREGYGGHSLLLVTKDQPAKHTFTGHTLKIRAGVIFPNGKRIASAGYGRVIRVWDIEAEKEAFILRGHTDIIFGLAISGDGRWLLSCGNDRTARVWNMNNGRLVATYTADRPLHKAVASPDGRWFAVAKSPLGRVHLLQLLLPSNRHEAAMDLSRH